MGVNLDRDAGLCLSHFKDGTIAGEPIRGYIDDTITTDESDEGTPVQSRDVALVADTRYAIGTVIGYDGSEWKVSQVDSANGVYRHKLFEVGQ